MQWRLTSGAPKVAVKPEHQNICVSQLGTGIPAEKKGRKKKKKNLKHLNIALVYFFTFYLSLKKIVSTFSECEMLFQLFVPSALL